MSIIEKLKLVYKLAGILQNFKGGVMENNGVKSSSFLVVLLAQAPAIVALFTGLIPASAIVWLLAYSAVISSVYMLARAIIKQSVGKKDDEAFNKIIAIIKPITDKIGIQTELLEIPKEDTPVSK